jgi:hypothetical protein
MAGIMLDFETADRITVDTMKNQLKEQKWFEADSLTRKNMESELGYRLWVHPEDYAKNAQTYIPALRNLIEYFGGTV